MVGVWVVVSMVAVGGDVDSLIKGKKIQGRVCVYPSRFEPWAGMNRRDRCCALRNLLFASLYCPALARVQTFWLPFISLLSFLLVMSHEPVWRRMKFDGLVAPLFTFRLDARDSLRAVWGNPRHSFDHDPIETEDEISLPALKAVSTMVS